MALMVMELKAVCFFLFLSLLRTADELDLVSQKGKKKPNEAGGKYLVRDIWGCQS